MRKYKSATFCYQFSANRFQNLVIKFVLFTLTFLFVTFSTFAQRASKAIQQGNEAYRKNDFSAAVKEYTKALAEDDKNAIASFNMANALQRNNSADKAAGYYDEVITRTDNEDLRSKAYYNKAIAMLQQKDLPGAIDALKHSLRLAPADNDARENLQKAINEQKQQQQQQQQNKDKKQSQDQQQDQKKKPREQEPKMDKQQMEQKFKQLQNQEKQLQKELQKQRVNPQEQEKDW